VVEWLGDGCGEIAGDGDGDEVGGVMRGRGGCWFREGWGSWWRLVVEVSRSVETCRRFEIWDGGKFVYPFFCFCLVYFWGLEGVVS
jgi:hypothetical protein